jgi:hypothetical protein
MDLSYQGTMSVPKSASPLSIFGVAVAALALAAGCSGQPHGSTAIPGALPGAPDAAAPQRAVAVRPLAAEANTISVTIQTLLPSGHAPHVVALGLELDGARKTFVPINIGSKPTCVQQHAGFSCRVSLKTAAGEHWLTVDGYKSPLKGNKPPSQKPISTNGIPVDAKRATTKVALAMYSQTASIFVSGWSAGITGDAALGFEIDRSAGPDPATFALVTQDASGKIIVGPSTDTFAIKSSNKSFVVTTPEPNQFVLDATAVVVAATTKIGVVAGTKCGAKCKLSFEVSVTAPGTPTPSPSPTASSTPTPVPTATPIPTATPVPTATPTPQPSPLVFVSYSTSSGGAIRAFSLQGALQTSWTVSNSAGTLAFDSSNGFLYAVTNGAASPITAYDHSGNVQTLSPGFGSLGTVKSITYDSHNNELYVAVGSTIKAYDGNGNLELGSAFSGFTSTTAGGMTFDASNRNLYIIDGTSLEEWSEAGVKASTSGFAAPTGCNTAGCVPTALVFNPPGLNWLFTVWTDGSKTAMACYQQTGNNCVFHAGASAFNTIKQPAQITYYSLNGNVYVASVDGITVWDLEGNKQTTIGTFPSGSVTAINGIAIGQ